MNSRKIDVTDSCSEEVKTTLVSHNITVLGKRTSVRLEPEMWNALREISNREHCKIGDICSLIYLRKNPKTSLTAAIRVFMMLYYRSAATENGHEKAGHGDFKRMIERAKVVTALFPRFQGMSYDNYTNSIDPATRKLAGQEHLFKEYRYNNEAGIAG